MRIGFSILLLIFSLSTLAQSSDWVVKKDTWTGADEKKFSEFIEVMGQSGCRTFDSCIKSPASNPFYHNRTPKNVKYLADCADLPFVLRAYFAWMEGLSFDYVSVVKPSPENGSNVKDIRYTKFGNMPTRYTRMTKGNVYNGPKELRNLINRVSTAMYRFHYKYVTDFYPTPINRENVKPGTVLYDASGHAGIIYKVERNGIIHLMDAHPDQSITRIQFTRKFSRSRIHHGAGFRNWRPELSSAPTESLSNFSTEQFNRAFFIGSDDVDYHEYVRNQLAGGNLKFDPVEEQKILMKDICVNINDRIHAVDAALKVGIQHKPHPTHLPDNIYGTSGEWEEYSTPSRDARLKTSFKELLDETYRYLDMFLKGNERVQYTPVHSAYSAECSSNAPAVCYLVASLLTAYDEVARSPECSFSYTNSKGYRQNLSYDQVAERIFDLSFDPYHCPELRWGATDGVEFSSCPDGRNKLDWYNAERNLRNQIERTYDAPMGYNLEGTRLKLGVSQAPNVDLKGYLLPLIRYYSGR